MIAPLSNLENKIVTFFKAIIVLFALLSIIEIVVIRHLDFMDDYLGNRKEIVSDFKKNNFLFLIGFTNEVANNNERDSINYILIPKNISLPTILSVYEYTDGVVDYENGSTLEAILGIFLLLYGFYLIGCFIKSKISPNDTTDNQGPIKG